MMPLRGGITTTFDFILYNGVERRGDTRRPGGGFLCLASPLLLLLLPYFLSIPAIACCMINK